MEGETVLPSVSMSFLDRLRAGIPEDWDRLVKLFSPVIYHWVKRSNLQDSDIADICQEVFSAAYLGLGAFHKDSQGGSFRGWLYRVTQSKIRDFYRRKKKTPTPAAEGEPSVLDILHGYPAEENSESEPNPQQSTKILAQRAIDLICDDFDPKTWAAFYAVTVDSRPPADVAVEIGISVSSVYVAKSRVLKRLREELAGLI